MQVRYPELDFTTADPHWGDNAEAVAVINAGAVIPAALERYMIRVLRQARKLLDPVADAQLISDIDLFNKQEGQHAKLHAAYLVMLRDGGYPRITEFEAAYAADLDRFIRDETLGWNLGYSEGFESTGAAMAGAWVDGVVRDLCGDHGSLPMELWMWHLAEEFEHRSVVHDVLHRLFDADEALALRTAGADFGRAHFGGHSAQAAAYINEIDRAGMSTSELDASVEREQQMWLALGAATGDRLAWVYESGYDPATIEPPRDYETLLAVRLIRGESGGGAVVEGGANMGTALDDAAGAQVGRALPGISVVVTSTDSTVLDAGFGLADRASETTMSSDTVCNWFSMTKLVTATAAVQLADRGLLDLDAPVARYYEPFAAMQPEGRAHQVSTRHLLGHSAGVVNPIPLRWVHLATRTGPPRDEFVAAILAKHRRLKFEPGTEARYTNLGYLVVGEVIAAAANQSFEDYVREHVLAPLGMSRTDFVALDEAQWATPYQRRFTMLSTLMPMLIPRELIGPKDRRFVSLRHFYLDGAAYGGLVGPASDAIRFARAHVRGGELDGTRILSEPRCREMQMIATRGRKLEVGLGWFRRGRAPSPDFVEHLGGGMGFWNCLRIYPERGVGVVVMGNATSYDHDVVARAAVDEAGT